MPSRTFFLCCLTLSASVVGRTVILILQRKNCGSERPSPLPRCQLESGRKLKLQYLGHLMQRADSLEKTLMLGKFEGIARRNINNLRYADDTPLTTESEDELKAS